MLDFVVVCQPPQSGQTGIPAKWLPRWTGPSDADTYRLEHVETGKLLDPTNIDKLVKVEPWSVNKPNHQQLNPIEGEDTPPDNPPSIPIPQFENGSLVVYEKLGDILDDDIKTMIKELCDWLKLQDNNKSLTGEACKHLYAKNPEYKKILQSVGGIRRQLLIHTPSVQFEMPDATGGNNYLKLSDAAHSVKYHLDRLGGRYGIGEVINYYEDVYELELWDKESKKTKWNKPLKPVKIDNEVATELVQPTRVLCRIELVDKYKLGKMAEK